jgi:ferredoxin-NADP reductase
LSTGGLDSVAGGERFVARWTEKDVDPWSKPPRVYAYASYYPLTGDLKLIADAYSRVVTIATGAGIAPCLPQISNATSDIYLIWLANDHQNYGPEVCGIVSSLPREQVVLHSTGKTGRPGAVEMIQSAVEKHRAEAVFVVSNQRYTKAISQICWKMGIRCYGATWDS